MNDERYLLVELVCLYMCMIYCVSSRCFMCFLPIEHVYLHRAKTLGLGWLDDDLGQDTSSKLSTLGSQGTIKASRP